MLKILMLGPGQGVVGGIATVVSTLIPVLEKEVDLLYVPMTKGRMHKGDAGRITFKNILAMFRQFVHFIWVLLRFRPEIVHLHTSEGFAWLKDTFYIWVSWLSRTPFVLHVHAADMDRLYAKRPSWEQWYTRKTMSKTTAVIAVSEQWRTRLGTIIPIEKVYAFRNCVNVSTFVQSTKENISNVKILFLGSIGPRKGFYDLVSSGQQLKEKKCDFTMWLAGYEEADGQLEKATKLIKEQNLERNCHLLGIILGEQKNDLLQTADIFVLPSYNEGLPIAILEAMAAGLPMVVSSVGGIPEVVIDAKNGFVIEPGDVDSLTNALQKLIEDRNLRIHIGQENRHYADMELDVYPYIKKLLDLYESILPAKKSSYSEIEKQI